jgi:hypothetical protein
MSDLNASSPPSIRQIPQIHFSHAVLNQANSERDYHAAPHWTGLIGEPRHGPSRFVGTLAGHSNAHDQPADHFFIQQTQSSSSIAIPSTVIICSRRQTNLLTNTSMPESEIMRTYEISHRSLALQMHVRSLGRSISPTAVLTLVWWRNVCGYSQLQDLLACEIRSDKDASLGRLRCGISTHLQVLDSNLRHYRFRSHPVIRGSVPMFPKIPH